MFEVQEDTTPKRKPQYTGKNRFTAEFQEYYKQFTVRIELDTSDDIDEPARVTKTYWRSLNHTHWVEEYSGKVATETRNVHLWHFLNKMVENLNPPAVAIDAIRAQVKKAR